MSLSQLRARFKSSERKHSGGKYEALSLLEENDESFTEELRSGNSADKKEKDLNKSIDLESESSEKDDYDKQLSNLQEQLVATMIENENLASELKSYQEDQNFSNLNDELENEKRKNEILLEEVRQLGQRIAEEQDKKLLKETAHVEQKRDSEEEDKDSQMEAASEYEAIKANRTNRLVASLVNFYYNFIADLTEDEGEVLESVSTEGDPLTVKKLKENIVRFTAVTKPIWRWFHAVSSLLSWNTPTSTLIAFTIYMYAVWYDWLLPILLGHFIYWLTTNYLGSIGWKIHITLLPYKNDEDDTDQGDKNLADKFQLVLQVSRKVQNALGKIADSLEKIKNLLLWKEPSVAWKLYIFCLIFFLSSCYLQGKILYKIVAFSLGVKMFIINLIYLKFPKVKYRHDILYKSWKMLPTDAQLAKRNLEAEQKLASHSSGSKPKEDSVAADSLIANSLTTNAHMAFCKLFNLPPNETYLPDWPKRCTLIDKDKSLTNAFKHGKLYLTKSFLCFERSKAPSPKNLIIPLSDIATLEKAKPYAFIPGSGTSIEVTLISEEKPYLFGAIINRDEAYNSVMAAARMANLQWAIKEEDSLSDQLTLSTQSVKC